MRIKAHSFAKKILIAGFAMLLLALLLVSFGGNAKDVFATGDVVSVTIDGDTENFQSVDDAFDEIFAKSPQTQVTVTILADCQISKAIENDDSDILILTNGDFTLSRSGAGSFMMFSNFGTLQIGADNSAHILTLDGANMTSPMIVNDGTLRLCNVAMQNGTAQIDDDGGAIKNTGDAKVNNVKISNFTAKNGGAIYSEGANAIFQASNLEVTSCSATESLGVAILNRGGRLSLFSADIHNNITTASISGIVANVGLNSLSSAKMTFGLQNQPVKIYDNSTFGDCAGILNGNGTYGAEATINNVELCGNTANLAGSIQAGIIKNFGTADIVYANIHDNISKCVVDGSGETVSCASALLNMSAGEANIVKADISKNQLQLFSDSTYATQIDLTNMTSACHTFGGGIANFGTVKLNSGNISDNIAFLGADVFDQDVDASNQSTFSIVGNSEKSTIGDIHLDSQNPISIAQVNGSDILTITSISVGTSLQRAGQIVFSIDSQSQNNISEMIAKIAVADGFALAQNGSSAVLQVSSAIDFRVSVSATNIVIGTECLAIVDKLTVQGKTLNVDDYKDSIEYVWYASDSVDGEKTQIATGSRYVVGTGLVGKYIFASAKLIAHGYYSDIGYQQAGDMPVQTLTVFAKWNLTNSFYSGIAKEPKIDSFVNANDVAIDVDSLGAKYTLTYQYFDATTQKQVTPKNAGKYVATAKIVSDDLVLDEDSGTTSFSIFKNIVRKPSITSSTQIAYNFKEQTIPVEYDAEHSTISGNKGTKMGEYVLTISLIDTQNYMWADETVAPIQVKWQIVSPISPWIIVSLFVVILALVVTILVTIAKNKKRQERLRENINIKAIGDFNKKQR